MSGKTIIAKLKKTLRREIKKRRELEKELNLFKSVVESSEDALIFKDVNPAAEKINNIDRREGRRDNRICKPPTGEVVAIYEDITDHKKAKEELRRYRMYLEDLVEKRTGELKKEIQERKSTEEKLAEREKTFRVMLDTTLDSVALIKSDGTILAVNTSLARKFNRHPSQMVGKNTFEFLPPELAESRKKKIEETIRTKRPVCFKDSRDGIFFQNTLTPITDQDGNPTQIVIIASDVTERETYEKELRKAKETAEFANHAKSQFLANMSHELRTPLNSVLGYAQLIGRDPELPAHIKDKLNIIMRSGDHLMGLINDILEMSKIEAGQVELETAEFDLLEMLDELADMFRVRAEAKGLGIFSQYDSSVPRHVRTDERKLRQVLINIMGNALKFTETGSISLNVATAAYAGKGNNHAETDGFRPARLQFEITDTGPGIPEEDLDCLFDMFAQPKSVTTKGEGAGLGLAISRSFVRKMGGGIFVRSEVGIGTVFGFIIEAEQRIKSPTASCRTEDRIVGLAPDQPPCRVLIVEDNPINRKMLYLMLESAGFDVRKAVNGKEAVEQYQNWRPHIVWMDMMMPVMDGIAATKQIRGMESEAASREDESKTVIIALTADVLGETREKAVAAGCDDYLTKPVKEADVFKIMRKHLGLNYLCEKAVPRNGGKGRPDSASLAVLSTGDLNQLEHYVTQGDKKRMLNLIETFRPAHGELADALEKLAGRYRFRRILDLITEARGKI